MARLLVLLDRQPPSSFVSLRSLCVSSPEPLPLSLLVRCPFVVRVVRRAPSADRRRAAAAARRSSSSRQARRPAPPRRQAQPAAQPAPPSQRARLMTPISYIIYYRIYGIRDMLIMLW
eukprot:scaffold25631_cov157-Isochrysis_galbana.AAC.1